MRYLFSSVLYCSLAIYGMEFEQFTSQQNILDLSAQVDKMLHTLRTAPSEILEQKMPLSFNRLVNLPYETVSSLPQILSQDSVSRYINTDTRYVIINRRMEDSILYQSTITDNNLPSSIVIDGLVSEVTTYKLSSDGSFCLIGCKDGGVYLYRDTEFNKLYALDSPIISIKLNEFDNFMLIIAQQGMAFGPVDSDELNTLKYDSEQQVDKQSSIIHDSVLVLPRRGTTRNSAVITAVKINQWLRTVNIENDDDFSGAAITSVYFDTKSNMTFFATEIGDIKQIVYDPHADTYLGNFVISPIVDSTYWIQNNKVAGPIFSLSSHGEIVVFIGPDGVVYIMEKDDIATIKQLVSRQETNAKYIQLSEDCTSVAIVCEDNSLVIIHLNVNGVVSTIKTIVQTDIEELVDCPQYHQFIIKSTVGELAFIDYAPVLSLKSFLLFYLLNHKHITSDQVQTEFKDLWESIPFSEMNMHAWITRRELRMELLKLR